jgi:hypothetical protein
MEIARNSANATIGNINFGDSISGFTKILKQIFFRHFEKITVRKQLPEAYMFDTGAKDGKLMMLGLQKILRNKILS